MRVARAALAIATGALLASAPTAHATACGDLQDALDAVPPDGTVTVDAGSSCVLAAPLTWNGKAITFDGAGSTLGAPANDNAIEVFDIGASTIRNVTVRGANPPNGQPGAISVTGNSTPTFDGVTLLGNAADATGTNPGGGISLDTIATSGTIRVLNSRFGNGTPGGRNFATEGGGLWIDAPAGVAVEIANSSFEANEAVYYGGGVEVTGLASPVTITGNTFTGNKVVPPVGGNIVRGGGLYVANFGQPAAYVMTQNTFQGNRLEASAGTSNASGGAAMVYADDPADSTLTSTGNRFDGNTITAPDTDLAVFGGGLLTIGLSLRSRDDRFTNNSLPAVAGESEGAGLSIEGCGSAQTSASRLENALVTGNSAAGTPEGAGVYVGCATGPVNLSVFNSTITRNTSGGDTAGLWGGTDDALTMVNSVVAGNTGGLDIAGFDAGRTVTFSDVCVAGAPHTGTGNLCAPTATNADGTLAASTPLIDAGTNAGIPPGLTSDAFGGARLTDGNGDGSALVDIGADEAPAVATPSPSPSPSPAPDTTAPVISGFKASRKKFSFTLSEAANVRITVARRTRGRRVAGKCVKRTRKNARRKKCTRYVRQAVVRAPVPPGATTLNYNGRKLRRGRYRATIVATDVAGNRSAARRKSYRIKK